MDNIIINRVKMMKTKPFCIVNTEEDEYKINNDLIYKYRIEKGRRFSEEEFTEILNENNLMIAKKSAYEFASYAPRSEKKVRQKLDKLGYDDKIIEICIDFLYEFEQLNDEEYARKYLNDFLLKKKAGRNKIINKLYENGVDLDLAKRITYELITDDDEQKMIGELLEDDFRFQDISIQKKKSRLINRGFSLENINSVLS